MVDTVRRDPLIGLLGQAMLLVVLAATVGLGGAGWLVGTAVAVVTYSMLTQGLVGSGAVTFGAANQVTLARAALVGAIAALIADAFVRPPAMLAIVTLTAVALALDTVDGKVARRTGTTSLLGARFDMEVDAFLILVLSIDVARSLGAWVLAIGGARYAFVAAGWLMPWLRETPPPRYWCKVVAAIEGIVLAVAVTELVPAPIMAVALAASLALLAESFGREAWSLHRLARTRRAPAPNERHLLPRIASECVVG
jgi:phosphatidylglycerophosphate synthase